jgi:hypothetical protein
MSERADAPIGVHSRDRQGGRAVDGSAAARPGRYSHGATVPEQVRPADPRETVSGVRPAEAGATREAGAIELFPGELHALGGVVPIDGRLSWLADGARGFAPLHCYLLRDGEHALLVDSGVPAHEPDVLRQLAALVPGGSLALLLSRIVEFDSFGNAAAVIGAFDVLAVHSQFPAGEWVWYRAGHDRAARPATPPWHALRGGLQVPLGAPGRARRTVEAIDGPLRLLATTWVYDPGTRALFTSDAFGHAARPSAGGPTVVEAANDETTLEDVRDHLLAKFAWLAAADTDPIRRQLAEIFETRRIEIVAPTYGRPLVGRAVVERHYELVQRALARVGAAQGAVSRA